MATIRACQKADGSVSYSAQIRIKWNGAQVYQESQTFVRRKAAEAWVARRESELAAPGAIARESRVGVTLRGMVARYLDEHGKTRPLGKTKQTVLRRRAGRWSRSPSRPTPSSCRECYPSDGRGGSVSCKAHGAAGVGEGS